MPKVMIDMEMPKNCNECIFLVIGPYPHYMKYCSVTRRILNRLVHYAGKRHCWIQLNLKISYKDIILNRRYLSNSEILL